MDRVGDWTKLKCLLMISFFKKLQICLALPRRKFSNRRVECRCPANSHNLLRIIEVSTILDVISGNCTASFITTIYIL